MSIDNTLVSIIIPLYNHQDFIEECLYSVFQQTFRNLEIILIDDGSSDSSAEIAGKILQECPFSYQFIHQENQGAHAAINRGIRIAQGEYITILDSDDRYHPHRIEILLKQALRTNARMLFSGVCHIDALGKPLPNNSLHCYYYQLSNKASRFFPTPDFELIRHNRAITTSNYFFQRSLMEEIGDFANLLTCHDWDYLLRVLLIESPGYVDQELLEYRVHGANTLQLESDSRYHEIDQILAAYLSNVDQAKNPFAPGPAAWGAYWPIFRDVFLKHLNKYPQTKRSLHEKSKYINTSQKRFWELSVCFYHCLVDRGFNQYLWQERELRKNRSGMKIQLHRVYINFLSWTLARAARLIGKLN